MSNRTYYQAVNKLNEVLAKKNPAPPAQFCAHCKKSIYQTYELGGLHSNWFHTDTGQAECELVVTYATPRK